MLQDLIKDLQSSLKSYSLGLAKRNLLVDIPWTMVDGDLNLQRLIFRKDNSLYIVKEGEIQESKWEYLPTMNSLVIEVGGRKILMNEVFADGKALVLKKDGIGMNFLAFANQNEITNLDLECYFKKIGNKKRDLIEEKLKTQEEARKGREALNNVIYLLLSIVGIIAFILYLSKN